MKSFKKLFTSSSKKNYLHLKENIELLEQALFFIKNNPNIPNHILLLKEYGVQWLEVAKTWHYLIVWDILTFYRCIEKLKKVKNYFDQPKNNNGTEYDRYKNIYYVELSEVMKKYEIHYQFSKIMWDKFNEIYGINSTSFSNLNTPHPNIPPRFARG